MKVTRRDVSGEYDNNNLPPVPERDLYLFHWSPTKNRKQINKLGLRIGGPSLQIKGWRPPCTCFCDDPWLAWILSGNMWPEIKSWDLWMLSMEDQTSFKHYEIITDTYVSTGRHYIKEYRVYDRVYKRDLTYLATRVSKDTEYVIAHISETLPV